MRIPRWTVLCLLLSGLLSLWPAFAAAGGAPGDDDWPTVRHDERNTGYTADHVSPPLRLAWRVQTSMRLTPGISQSSILLSSQGVVCVGQSQPVASGNTLLYDRSGHLLWRIDGSAPVYLKGQRLIVAYAGDANSSALVRCYNWRTKAEIWSYALDGVLMRGGGAAAADGKLYCVFDIGTRTTEGHRAVVAEGDRVVVALNLDSGELIARHQDEATWGEGPPAYDGATLSYGTGHWLHVLDARTLEPRFAFADGGNCYPIRVGDLLIAKGWLHHVNAWDITTRKAAWQIDGPRDVVHCLAHGRQGKMLLIESSSALDVTTGQRVWNTPVYSWCAAGAGGLVYLAGSSGGEGYPDSTNPGGFYGVNAATGRIRWRYERSGLRGIAAIVSSGNLYGLGSDGYLYKFAPRR